MELNRIEAKFTDDDVVHIGLALEMGTMTGEQLAAFILERVM